MRTTESQVKGWLIGSNKRYKHKLFQKHGHGKSNQTSDYPKNVHTPMPFSCKTKETMETQAK